jgi:3D (Asp-Asp-Asp) domain-containing protein
MKPIFILAGLAFSTASFAKQTTYYTMLGNRVSHYECGMEGNQIVNGKLYGSGRQCRNEIPLTKYFPWGVGNRNNPLVPCVHAAGGRAYSFGERVAIKPIICPFGPLKGRRITSVIVADVGGAVNGRDIDVFTGICVKKKRDNCIQYAPDNTVANYGAGQGRKGVQMAMDLARKFAPGADTERNLVAMYGGGNGTGVASIPQTSGVPLGRPNSGSSGPVATAPPVLRPRVAAPLNIPPARRVLPFASSDDEDISFSTR